jgi:hypothetical protein
MSGNEIRSQWKRTDSRAGVDSQKRETSEGSRGVSYHTFTPKRQAGKIGKAIYLKALDDRRGFRYDQIGIHDDDIWLDIFEAMGKVAIEEAANSLPALVEALRAARDRLEQISNANIDGIGSFLEGTIEVINEALKGHQ